MSSHRGGKRNRSTGRRFDYYPRTPRRAPRPGSRPHPQAVLDDGVCWTWSDPTVILDRYKPTPPPPCAGPGCTEVAYSTRATYCGRACAERARRQRRKASP